MADDPAAAQLRDELGALAARVAAVLGTDLQALIMQRAEARADWLAAEISDGTFPDETAADLLALLWPDGPDLEWWRTPLGLLIAPTFAARHDGPGWSRGEAAVVLGVARGTVAQLVARGDLAQEPDGSVSRAAVLARLVRLAARPGRRPGTSGGR